MQDFETVWATIINDIRHNPRDIQTVRINGGGLWFHVYTDGDVIYVDKAEEKVPSSKLSYTRCINKEEFEFMYPIHIQRSAGQKIPQKEVSITHNQSYIYGIFHHCGRV